MAVVCLNPGCLYGEPGNPPEYREFDAYPSWRESQDREQYLEALEEASKEPQGYQPTPAELALAESFLEPEPVDPAIEARQKAVDYFLNHLW